MSYRVYLELYKNNEKISSHQLFGNNIENMHSLNLKDEYKIKISGF